MVKQIHIHFPQTAILHSPHGSHHAAAMKAHLPMGHWEACWEPPFAELGRMKQIHMEACV